MTDIDQVIIKTDNPMKKIVYSLLTVCCMVCLYSCAIDNYDEPDCTIYGTVIDDATGKPIQSQQPNGFKIRLMEYSWSETPQPLDFWGMADGTFRNTKIFAGEYGVQPIDGAFIIPEEQRVKIKGSGEVTFRVTPYLYITDVSFTNPVLDPLPDGGWEGSYKMEVSYKLGKPAASPGKIQESYVFFARSEQVGLSGNDATLSRKIDLSGTDDETITQTTYTQTITKLPSGKTYYFRVGARTTTSGRYNYSEVLEIKIP
jgi:hypothetical protein